MRLMAKENGPVFIVLLMVLLASAATLTGGIVRYMEDGEMTNSSLILILFGGIVFIFVTLGFAITICTEPHRPPTTLPYSDNPPKYRETWRRQHLESICSQATDTYTENPSPQTAENTATNLSRLDARSLLRSAGIAGVHKTPTRTRAISENLIGESQVDPGPSTGRPARAQTDPHAIFIYDDGLPSYEEALTTWRKEGIK